MGPYLNVIQILISLLLVTLVLLQARGSGLGSVFGQDNAVIRTRRGAERVIFQITIAVAIIFCALSIITVRVVH
ncbi:MAG TPA: preprotein translocase subunit SecG [Chloroflexota bacterium]|nr:preprotein translocase subunit SecG [Chloroflexota bacterium]